MNYELMQKIINDKYYDFDEEKLFDDFKHHYFKIWVL